MTEYDKLRFDPIPYLLALAFADNALFGLNSPAALWTRQQQTRIPKGQSIHLLWKESVLEQPILRNVTMANGASDTKAMNRETFCRLFRAII
ncbi:MAG: hypothetical protein M1834_001497, partial [Cirrosporium novae-zelandiae]